MVKERLVADSIAKSFGERRILSSATLRAVAGEVRVLFGRNGIGKSTLMRIAVGRDQPDSGIVRFAGRARLSVSLPALAREGLFYLADEDLFSSGYTLRRQLSFLQNTFSGGSVESAAERVGVSHALDQAPHAMSGGERRRAELAAILVRQPTCLVADEPYRGIGPRDAEMLSSIFRELAAKGCAVVLSGHEIHTLLDVADHVTWCTAGTTYELGSPREARAHERFRQEYLGPRLH
ncbi:MAG: ATP-binding cassette domain-containing protein [Gemmatimonadaceae bacterium]|nr:ATP-binding cassette domain-containing protein [Gemmatimonadaceae bacterium]